MQITEWVLLIVAYWFVSLRIYGHVTLVRKKLNWSEMLLVAAALDALGLIICDTLTFQMGVMDNYSTSTKLSKASTKYHFLLCYSDRSGALWWLLSNTVLTLAIYRFRSLRTISMTLAWAYLSSVCWLFTGLSSILTAIKQSGRCCGV